jgi:hypothetical protein
MAFMAHHARLDALAKDGASNRSHLESAARRGVASAIQALEGPDYPHSVHYLREWVTELHGQSGHTSVGTLVPLTFTTVDAWARMTGNRPAPHEVVALLELDRTLCYPPDEVTDG